MSKRKLVVPEAREALEQFKIEFAKEYGVDDPRSLTSSHTGYIVRDLVELGQKQLMEENNEK